MEMKKTQMTLIDLPETAIDEILHRLPIRDAIRTSILSRSWRHRWKSIPHLKNLSCTPDAIISQILLLHLGPLRLFKAQTAHNPAVYDWIATLSRRSASTLRTLDLSSNFYIQIHSIARFFPCLTHLYLSSADLCILPACFSGLTALRTLHLDACRLRGQVSVLISACPLLETLTLAYICLDGPQRLDIVAPNLRWLKLVELNRLIDFSVTSSPVLEMATIDCCVLCDGGGIASGNCNVMKVLGGMACVKMLELGSSTLKFLRRGNIPERLAICFDHLRFMSLGVNFGDAEELLVSLCLLRSTPNLQELEFKGCFYNREVLEARQVFQEAQEYVGLFDKLETVKMTGIECVEAELDFTKFALAKARALKTIMIVFSQHVSNKELFMMKLLEFPRVSNQSRMVFK